MVVCLIESDRPFPVSKKSVVSYEYSPTVLNNGVTVLTGANRHRKCRGCGKNCTSILYLPVSALKLLITRCCVLVVLKEGF